jgi:hypothetical protein
MHNPELQRREGLVSIEQKFHVNQFIDSSAEQRGKEVTFNTTRSRESTEFLLLKFWDYRSK